MKPLDPEFASPICVGCAYPLRGLGPRGRCPECGNEFILGAGNDAPPRCPSCTFTLASRGPTGFCPQCQTRYAGDERFAYLRKGNLVVEMVMWLWPVVLAWIALACLVATRANAPGAVMAALPMAALANAIWMSHRARRRADLRDPALMSFVATSRFQAMVLVDTLAAMAIYIALISCAVAPYAAIRYYGETFITVVPALISWVFSSPLGVLYGVTLLLVVLAVLLGWKGIRRITPRQ